GGPSPPRFPAGHTPRPAASPVLEPHPTPGSDHQRMRAPPGRHAVISSHRCPLEPRNRSLSNFYSPSSEGISMPDTHVSIEINRWIEAQCFVMACFTSQRDLVTMSAPPPPPQT